MLDPFCGAATTGLACLKNGRDFTGLELKPEYAQLAIGRVQRIYPLLAAGAEISAGAIPDALGAGPDWNRDLQVMSLAR